MGYGEEYDIYKIATPEAWNKDPELVTDFITKEERTS